MAAVVLQLVDEQVLALSDPISKWLPTFPVPTVTVEQLLHHTSGLVDYLFDTTLQATQAQPHTADELYDIASRVQSGATAPGPWHYSNTNYLLLARIIGIATGSPWYLEVRRRILDRPDLRLSSTFIYGFEPMPRLCTFSRNGVSCHFDFTLALLFEDTCLLLHVTAGVAPPEGRHRPVT